MPPAPSQRERPVSLNGRRPVVLITLGITDDADAAVLKQISDATPGAGSRVARNADEIPNIVIDLIKARTAAR